MRMWSGLDIVSNGVIYTKSTFKPNMSHTDTQYTLNLHLNLIWGTPLQQWAYQKRRKEKESKFATMFNAFFGNSIGLERRFN